MNLRSLLFDAWLLFNEERELFKKMTDHHRYSDLENRLENLQKENDELIRDNQSLRLEIFRVQELQIEEERKILIQRLLGVATIMMTLLIIIRSFD